MVCGGASRAWMELLKRCLDSWVRASEEEGGSSTADQHGVGVACSKADVLQTQSAPPTHVRPATYPWGLVLGASSIELVFRRTDSQKSEDRRSGGGGSDLAHRLFRW
jgi:hypothetical protein